MGLVDEKNADLVQIDLPTPGEWVKVLPKISRGHEVAIRRAGMSNAKMAAAVGAQEAGGSNLSIDMDAAIEAAEFARLDIVIKAWSFADPVSKANIRRLEGADVDCIKEKLDEIYPKSRSDAEKND